MTDIRDTVRSLTAEQKLKLQQSIAPLARRPASRPPGPATRSPDETFPLTSAQKRLWFLDALDGPSDRYVLPLVTNAIGPFDHGRFERAVAVLVARHEAFRTTFTETSQGPRSRIAASLAVAAPLQDLSHLPLDAARAAAEAQLQAAVETPFDLATGPLLRAQAIRICEQEHLLVLATHHIVADGWSLEVLKRELLALYSQPQDAPAILPDLAIQFVDYAVERAANDTFRDRDLAYWRTAMREAPLRSVFPLDFPRRQPAGPAGHRRLDVPEATWAAVRDLARRARVTPFVVLLAAFKLLLARYSLQDDVIVGTSMANRAPGVEGVIGYFAETVPLRTIIGDTDVEGLLKAVQETLLTAQDHSQVGLEAIVDAAAVPRIADEHPLFEVMFDFETGHGDPVVLGGLKLTPLPPCASTAKFDMSIEVQPQGEGLLLTLEHRADLWEPATIERILKGYLVVLDSFTARPGQALADVDLLSDEDRDLILRTWGVGPLRQESVRSAHAMFEQQVDRTPDRVAIESGGQTLTYAQADALANGVAAALRAAGVRPGALVGLQLGRDERHALAMLGVMKAGAAFIPLSQEWPWQRLDEIVRSSGLAVVLAQAEGEAVPAGVATVPWSSAVALASPTRPAVEIGPSDLAYAIYTSGSTGTPKGALIEHAGMINHLRGKIAALSLGESSVIAETAVTTFDVSVWQYLAAMMVGGRTVVLEGDTAWDPQLLLEALELYGVTVLESVPSHTRVLLDELARDRHRYPLRQLRYYVSNGEALTADQARRWLSLAPQVPIVNTYGITEVSDDVTHHVQTTAPAADDDFMPVGAPIANARIYILDGMQRPVPPGALGELAVGGIPVGRGYLNAPGMTAERFIPDPHHDAPGQRLYLSGDLARWRSNGQIEFIGRRDFQVKIRGHRIEIGEIEAALLRRTDVASCVVLALAETQGDPRVVAFVVASQAAELAVADLARHCTDELTQHMRPAAYVVLEDFPLTESGKIDRKRLALLAPTKTTEARVHAPPVTEIEQRLCRLWANTLKVDAVGLDDSFFELGGHSLLAAELATQMRIALDREIPLRALFDAPTVRGLLARLSESRDKASPQMAPPKARGHREAVPLAACQVPEWFAHQLAPDSPVYNISFTELLIRGLEPQLFIEAWTQVIARHDVFQTRIRYVDGRPLQSYGPPQRLDPDEVILDRRGLTHDEILSSAQAFAEDFARTSFDFENGPLFRLNLVDYGEATFQLLFAVHHVIWDETSSMNLMRELSATYNALLSGRSPSLPELALTYGDYVSWVNEQMESGALDTDRDYWMTNLADPPPALALPTDFARPPLQDFAGDSVLTWLTADQVRAVRLFCGERDLTLFMFFLAAIQLYLARLTGASDFVIGCPIAGRDHAEFQPMLGLFASPMPIRWTRRPELSFATMAQDARRAAVDAYEHYRYPATAVIEAIEKQQDLSRPRLFSVMYGLQNNKTELLQGIRLGDATTEILPLYSAESHAARFDLTFAVEERGEAVSINCTYATSLWRRDTLAGWMAGFSRMLNEVLADPEAKIGAYSIVSPADEAVIERALQGRRAEADADGLLHALFSEQAHRDPARPCLRHGAAVMTYGSLEEHTNRLARQLAVQGVVAGSRVGLVLGLGVDLVACELALLKLGAAFVPLGRDLPPARAASVCRVAGVSAVIFRATPISGPECIGIDLDACEPQLLGHSSAPLERQASATDLAYILHTSGSTGEPKAIPVAHGGVVNVIRAAQKAYGLGPSDTMGMFTSPLFDPSLLDVFWPLSAGAQLYIPAPAGTVTPEVIADGLAGGVTAMQCVPDMLERLVALKTRGEIADTMSLRLIIVGGAILTRPLRDAAVAAFPARLMNHYGPTEVTIDAATFDCTQPFDGELVPIGQPLAGLGLCVLDDDAQVLPIGAEGELYIASPGLSAGYLGSATLTEQAFPSVGVGGRAPERMFRTGDIAKLSPRGDVIVLGRRDRQVKLGGARIELDEIDATLASHPLVASSYTKLVGSDRPALTAFVEPKPEVVRLAGQTQGYSLYTLEQRPELLKAFTALHLDAWPAFFEGDAAVAAYWSGLSEKFPAYQFFVVDEEDAVVAVGHTAPFQWRGDLADLPSGWSATLSQAVSDPAVAPDTLVAFVALVSPEHQSKGLSLLLLHALRRVCKARGLHSMLIPVRPTGKADHPQMPFADYCQWRRDDGLAQDPWLRTHERAGAKILTLAPASQVITGTVADWIRWTGVDVRVDPAPPGVFAPVEMDDRGEVATYVEPCVWVQHQVADDNEPVQVDWSIATLRAHLASRLPTYMTPQSIQITPRMPRTATGKIDGRKLEPRAFADERPRVAPTTDLQATLLSLWRDVLDEADIGTSCDFFALGGRSLDVIRMLDLVDRQLRHRVAVRDFYHDTTVAGLERAILKQEH